MSGTRAPLGTTGAGRTQTINLQLNGRSYGAVQTDDAGAASLQALMRGLQDAAGRSA